MARRLPYLAALIAMVVLASACGSESPSDNLVTGQSTTTAPAADGDAPAADAPPATDDPDKTTDPLPGDVVTLVDGMPPLVDPDNLYSEAGASMLSPAVADAIPRVYVPNEASGTVSVIDPDTFEVIDTFQTGFIPQHVVPSRDLQKLYVLNNNGNSIVPIDPATGAPGEPIYVDDPYNVYYTPDGSEGIIVAEAKQRIDFTDPETFEVRSSLQLDCAGFNHMDFSIDGRYALASCEFDGRVIKIDMTSRQVVGEIQLDLTLADKTDPIKSIAQPQDVRVSPDGSRFYVADLITDGVFVIDGETMTQIDHITTGIAAHGLYPSRDAENLYVINRGTNAIPPPGSFKGQSQGSVTVINFRTGEVLENWPIPDGGSPDMGNVSADGSQLWLAGRYDAEVYVMDTGSGALLARIPVGENPHGLTIWPQPGRVSFGHTGNMR